jgi:hypothetical protein
MYNKRAGIESTNSGIKRRTGMSRVSVRGEVSVYHAMLLRLAGWNIFQAAKTMKAHDYVREHMPPGAKQLIPSEGNAYYRSFWAQIMQKYVFRLGHEISSWWPVSNRLLCSV